ncbi:MAG: UDP-2,3-diacylglucosamine diphosphatase [Bacteroidetes bacterium]|nr:UDP-2,3-diacylglucosamine diphosphatase [Bacteroidota bacterium]
MGKVEKRELEIVVLSDIHLGTYGCHAEELYRYLKTIKPKTIVLNGDIIDMWQFSKRYWPKSHMQIVKYLAGLLTKGTKIIYLTGNHDEMLRKFAGFRLGSFQIENKKVITLQGKKVWIFHGDVFDVTMRYSKWLAKLGAVGYDMLILLNRFVNWMLRLMGMGKISLSKRVKDSVKGAVKFINDFEKTAAEIAISRGYDFVVCGHIHHADMKTIATSKGEVWYLNSGDWVENLTALEYAGGGWKLYRYEEDPVAKTVKIPKRLKTNRDNQEIFEDLVNEFLSEGSKEKKSE